MGNLKTSKIIYLTLLFLAIGLVFAGCGKLWLVANTNQNANTNQDINLNTNVSTTTGEIDTTNWKIYRNEEYGFEFKYPGDLIIKQSPIPLRLVSLGENNPEILLGWYELKSIDEKISLIISINPDGSGPYFPDKSYELAVDNDHFSITSIKDNFYSSDQVIPLDLRTERSIIALYYSSFYPSKKISQSNFMFKYFYDINSEFNEQTLKDIILSFNFY